MLAHVNPIAAHGLQLRRRSMLRHKDGAVYTKCPAAVGYSRAVVARRGGNYPAQILLGCKGEQLVHRAAQLEGAGIL